jgi:hypothetical protein
MLVFLSAVTMLLVPAVADAHEHRRHHNRHGYMQPYYPQPNQQYHGWNRGYYYVPQPPVVQWQYCDYATQGVLQCGPQGCVCVKWW